MDPATIFLNGTNGRRIVSEQEAEEACRYLAGLPSYWLTARRQDGTQLDVAADHSDSAVFYLDTGRSVKLSSLGPFVSDTEVVRMTVDVLPEMELEFERRHLVPREDALDMLRQFLVGDVPPGLVPWPDRDD